LYMHYAGGAFADWNRVLDELIERRFNTVRIDAFPLIIGRLNSEKQKITIAGDPLRNWGASDRDREHTVQQDLVEFLSLTKKKGLQVILSTWNLDCKEFPDIRQGYQTRELVWLAWEKTLDLLAKNDLLDQVLYVDLDQEFPFFSPFSRHIEALQNKPVKSSDNDMQNAGRIRANAGSFKWNVGQMDFVRELMNKSLAHFQHRYPQLRFTFSLTDYWQEVRALQITALDVLELHLWMSSSPRFQNRTGFDELVKDRGEHDYRDYMQRVLQTLQSSRPMLLQEMRNRMRFAQEWSQEIGAPLTTTEAWGPWWHMDHSSLDWQWLYDWCEQCMNLAPQYGFWGATPWNYSHPYWDNWRNVEWYRRVNENFLCTE
jgi:hypothetical protein